VDQIPSLDPFADWFSPVPPAPEGTALNLLTVVNRITVVRDPVTPLAQPTPIGVFSVPTPQANRRVLTLAPGQVLLSSRQLVPGGGDAITGFDITSGTLTFQADVTVVSGVIHVPSAGLVQLDAALQAPSAPSPGTGPGADASAVTASLPASVTIQFSQAGGAITQLADFGVTVYGTAMTMSPSNAAPSYNPELQQVLVPASVTQASFAVGQDLSTLLSLGGSAPVRAGAWALPVMSVLPPPGAVLGAGTVEFACAAGLAATWAGIGQAVAAQTAVILAAPGQIGVVLDVQAQSLAETFQLWQEAGGARNSTVDFSYPAQFALVYSAQPGQETLLLTGSASAHLDRPLRADGTRFALPVPACSQQLVLTAGGLQLTLNGGPEQPPNDPLIPLALENALLEVRTPESFSLAGTLAGTSVAAGTIALGFPLHVIVPTLPDPYACSVPASTTAGQQQDDLGQLIGTITWSSPASAELGFSCQPTSGAIPRLLDLSSQADQLGVMSGSDLIELTVAQLTLQVPGFAIGIFTVPEISWEPMVLDPPPESQSVATIPPDDGGLSTVKADTVQLVPVSPAVVANAIVQSVGGGDPAGASLTLPFGMAGDITTFSGATVDLNQPAFSDSLTGGIQIRMQPPAPDKQDAAFPGSATITTPYGQDVLGADVTNLFNQDFIGQSLPLRRYDLSGYGASLCSDWRSLNPAPAAIIKVQFSVFTGRTAYEVVEAQSLIYPWIINVVRTVTIERADLGGILNYDTGWQPASDGDFNFPPPPSPPFNVQSGPVNSVVNVRNIRDNGPLFPAGGATWRPVLFDADVELNANIAIDSGASGPNAVASRDMTGYLLETAKYIPTADDVTALLSTNTAAGPVSCTVTIAGSGAQLRASEVDVTGFLTGTTCVIVAALRGSPVLPPDGAWSVGKRAVGGSSPPLPLDPRFPVPLVQNAAQPSMWYYADPADILNLAGGTPAMEYGLLQSTGTQKLFFAQPQITQGMQSIQPQVQPHLADVGALLNAAGAFPDLRAALQIPAPFPGLNTSNPNGITFQPDSFALAVDPPTNQHPLPSDTLINFGADVLQVKLAYSKDGLTPGDAVVDIQPGSWQINLTGISLPVITPFGPENNPLLRIVGDFEASSIGAPTLSNLDVVYGSVLSEVQQVFSSLQHLAPFLPDATSLDVHFSDGKLTIRDTIALPQLPLGLGYVTDVSLDLGMSLQLSPQSLEFTAGIGSEQKPFHWLLSPLSGTGAVVVGMKDGLPDILVQAGLGVGLSIDIGIAEGSASIVLQVQVAIDGPQIHLAALLTGNASVDVLEGLASASLTMTASLGITLEDPPTSADFTASVSVGIHITVCWMVHIDFDGDWQFTQNVQLPTGSVIPT
jgi:hypothetical protein